VSDKHQMILETVYPSGNEVWNCSICGRKLMFSYEPETDLIVIETGNFYASHFGSKGGLTISSVETNNKTN